MAVLPPTPVPLIATLFDYLPLGLVVLDAAGQVVVYNRAEEQLAARSRSHVLGARFFHDVAPCMNVRELGGEFADRIGRGPFDTTVEMSFPFPHLEHPRDVRVRMCSLEAGGAPYAYLIVEDITLARAAQRMREKLQSLLVHDLKNPLAAIMANVELVQEMDGVRDSADAREALGEALDSAHRLSRMTVNLLDLARLEAAELPLRPTRTELGTLLARVVNDNRATARAYGARLVVQPGAAGLAATFDEDLVARALDNLVENAIRHAPEVTLAAAVDGGDLTLTVRDSGPGIPAEIRDRLFDRYVQVVTPGAARGNNRGLGLTFVKLVTRAHGGDVTVACPPGGGTVFVLRMPAAPAGVAASPR